MKPQDFEDIYQRYLSVAPVQRWLNLREPVGRLGEYLRVEDPMLLGLGLTRTSERGVKSPQVGDLYLVHRICRGFALGITLAQQVETYELMGTVQSVCKLKMPGQQLDYSNKIVVRRFAVDLERASKSLEMLEYNWLEDGGLVTQAKFTVVRQFPFPMTSHSEHRFWRPSETIFDMPSQTYARMVLREMSAPPCDGNPALQQAPCKFCMVYGRKTCCCPRTFRDRLRDEKTPIKCVRVLTGGTWSGYKGVFERAQLAGIVSVRWVLGDWKGMEKEVISSTLPYKCHVGTPHEIGALIRKFCLWTGQYREAPHLDNSFLKAAESDEFRSISTFLLPAPISDVSIGEKEEKGKSAQLGQRPEVLQVAPAQIPSVYNSVPSVKSTPSLRPDDTLSHAQNYSIASIDPRPRRVSLNACVTESQSPSTLTGSRLPGISTHIEDNVSYRTSGSGYRTHVLGPTKRILHGGITKRTRACSPPRLSPVTVSPNQSYGTVVYSEVDEGASHLMLLRSGTCSMRSHRSACEAPSTVTQFHATDIEGKICASTVDMSRASNVNGLYYQGKGAELTTGQVLAAHAIVDGKGKQANWRCHLCGQTFKGKRGNLNRHYHVVHAKEKRFVCEYPGCGQKFGYRLNLQRHHQNVHESRKFKCSHCGEGFKTYEKMDIHVKIVHEKRKKPYVCPICPDTAFGRKSSLTRHMANLHKPNSQNGIYHQGTKNEGFAAVSGGAAPLKVCM